MKQRRFFCFLLTINLAIPVYQRSYGLDDKDPGQQNETQSIWAASYASGLELSQVKQKPLLVVFGAEWCSWCRKLEKEIVSEAASDLRAEWILTKVDVDIDEELAAKFDVRALPTVVVVDTTGSKIESQEGYMPIDQLAGWLAEQKKGAISVLDEALQEAALPSDENIAKWASFLGDRRASIRLIAKQKFSQHRTKTTSAIVTVLENGSLAQRLSVLEVLEKWKMPPTKLDPWHPDTFGKDSIQAVNKWLEDNSVAIEVAPKNEKGEWGLDGTPTLSSGDDKSAVNDEELSRLPLSAEITKHLEKWKRVGEEGVELLLAEAFSIGAEKELIHGLKSLIEDEGLDEKNKTHGRLAYYSLLTSPGFRSEYSGLLKSLAGFDEAKRRRAGVAIAEKLSKEDVSLLKVLMEDQDSVIREASVEAISRADSENGSVWLTRLLNDPDRNVRGMSIKTLAPTLSNAAYPIVAKYIPTETDENLIVQAFKFLGSGNGYKIEKEYLELVPLLDHEQWRIRAEATDFLGKQIKNQSAYQSKQNDGLTEPIIEGLSARLLDPDTFVRSKVQEFLPSLVNAKTLPKLSKLLVDNVDLLDQVLESSQLDSRSFAGSLGYGGPGSENDKVADFLIGLRSSDESVRLVSAIFLAESKPEKSLAELHKHVKTDNQMLKRRIVHHAIHAFNNYRDNSTAGYMQSNVTKESATKRSSGNSSDELSNDDEGLDLFALFGAASRKKDVEIPVDEDSTRVEQSGEKLKRSDATNDEKVGGAKSGGINVDDFFGGSSSPGKTVLPELKEQKVSGTETNVSGTQLSDFDEPDLFGVLNAPEINASKSTESVKTKPKLRNFKEWMDHWNNAEESMESKSHWKKIAAEWLQSDSEEDRELGLILAPIVGLTFDQKAWLALLQKDTSSSIAASAVGWLPSDWTVEIGDAWPIQDKKRNQIFLKSFTSVVEPKRLIWLLDNKKQFVNEFPEAYTYISACLRTVLGAGVKYEYPGSNFGALFKFEKATDDVKEVVDELFSRVKKDDGNSVFAMAVLLELVPKEANALCNELLQSESTTLKSLAANSLLSKSSFANAKLLETIRDANNDSLDLWILKYLWGNTTDSQYNDMMLIYGGMRATQQTDDIVRFLKVARRGSGWKDWLKRQVEKNDPEAEAYLALMRISIDPDAPIELLERYPGKSGAEQSLNLVMSAVVASTREDAAAWLVERFQKLKAESKDEYLNSYSWNEMLKSRKGEWIKLRKILEEETY